MPSWQLEYRAKLVELIYSKERNLLKQFAAEADDTDPANGHGLAAYRILQGLSVDMSPDTIRERALELFWQSRDSEA